MSYYDDYTVGEMFKTPGRTITESDIALYAALSGDYDEKYVNATLFGPAGRRQAPPLLVFGISHGLLTRTRGWDTHGGIAFAGFENLKFLTPVFVGDTVHGEVTVSQMRVSKSKPDRGLVYYDYTLVNQNGVTVQHSVKKNLRLLRPAMEGERI